VFVGCWRAAPDDRYRREREEALLRGESWPSVTSLAELFGSYLKAAQRAWDLHESGPRGARGRSRRVTGESAVKFSRAEIVEAIITCHAVLGERWPTTEQYFAWAKLSNDMRLSLGGTKAQPQPVYPGKQAVRNHFDSYRMALDEAARQLHARKLDMNGRNDAVAATYGTQRPQPRRQRHPRITAT